MSGIEKRKQRHIRISLEEEVDADIGTGFEDVRLVHRALPETNLDEIDTKTFLFGKPLSAPLIISAITGGTEEAKEINKILASVAEKTGIGIGVGSQRIAIEHPETESTFGIVREMAPTSLVMGNIGCPQLSLGWGAEEAQKCIDMVDADVLAIHMNPTQEAVQVDGDTNYQNILAKISELSHKISEPIIMKETGCGIPFEDAMEIEKAGAKGIEVAGAGGTSWSAVEYHIARELGKSSQEYLGRALWNWGIPTAISVVEASETTDLKIIASGGIRTGVEIAKALVLGADAVGMAKPFLEAAMKSPETLESHINNIIREFKVAMFLVGAKDIKELKQKPAIILGKTAEWLRNRGFKPENYTRRVS
jgi:isopentenyl-diphosphate delta-isomerase